MNNIDIIIKYLSGDLDREARTEFEKAMETDKLLKDEYESVHEIWNIIKDQLRLDELPEEQNREEFIAELIAEHDINQYRSSSPSKKELAFREELGKVMLGEASREVENRKKPVKSLYRLSALIAAAASITLLFIFRGSGLDQIASDYYNPTKNKALEQYSLASRSEESNAIYLFSEGKYKAARISFENTLDSINNMEKLFYALSCNETGDHQLAISLLHDLANISENELSNESKWYLSLIYIQQGDHKEAQKLLEELKEMDVVYQKKTKKLLRRLE